MRSPIKWRLGSFKKIKNGDLAYSILSDESNFDQFQRNLSTTAKSHDVSEILDPTFTPGISQEEKELFESKQTFMYKVFNEILQTDIGRYKVRMHLRTTDAQAVRKESSEYMATAPKGASEKRKLTQYVSNTVLPHAIRPRTPKNPDQRLVATGGMEDHQLHPKTIESPTSHAGDDTPTMSDQSLVAAGGEEDQQPHSKDVCTQTKPNTPTLFIKSRHDDGPTPSKPLPEFIPDDLVGRTFLLPPADNGGEIKC